MRAVLVPMKAFSQAKHRLSSVLPPDRRAELARRLGELVLSAARGCPVHVACDDDEVADWASAHGAGVLFTPGLGLSGAVGAGVTHLAKHGVDLVVVAHADLPFAFDLDQFGSDGEVTLAPDRRLDGTNLAAVPAAAGFVFSYGPRSYDRHCAESERLGLNCRTIHNWRLACDIDNPADLELLRKHPELAGFVPDLTHTGNPRPAA